MPTKKELEQKLTETTKKLAETQEKLAEASRAEDIRFSNFWLKWFPSTKNQNEKFWVYRTTLSLRGGAVRLQLQFSKTESSSSWMTKIVDFHDNGFLTTLAMEAGANHFKKSSNS